MNKELNISKLSTEKRNVNSLDIDCKSSLEICEIMNNEDALVHLAVKEALEDIAKVINQKTSIPIYAKLLLHVRFS